MGKRDGLLLLRGRAVMRLCGMGGRASRVTGLAGRGQVERPSTACALLESLRELRRVLQWRKWSVTWAIDRHADQGVDHQLLGGRAQCSGWLLTS